jgi:virginiamycin B lyase
MSSDRVVRLDPKSGKAVEYLMPSASNMRTVYVDSNHAHALVKVEPLD